MRTHTLLRPFAVASAILLAASSAGAPTLAAQSEPRVLQNLDRNGLAIQGYDPVAYFTQGQAVKGNPAITATHDGATYRFASAEHLAAFKADPAKYAPSFGGYCAYGVSRGYAVSIDPEAFTIMNNRLLLQNSKSVLRRWQEDPETHLVKADSNWPGIVEKQGKPRN